VKNGEQLISKEIVLYLHYLIKARIRSKQRDDKPASQWQQKCQRKSQRNGRSGKMVGDEEWR
jgi:hypothetical protein